MALIDILKKDFLCEYGFCSASKLFSPTVAKLLPSNAEPIDAIHYAHALFLQASKIACVLPMYAIDESKIPKDLHDFSLPHSRQAVFDFSYSIIQMARKERDFAEAYNRIRPTMILHEFFAESLPIYIPVQFDAHVQAYFQNKAVEPLPKTTINGLQAA